VRRVAVVGNSGSGKTTLGRALAERLAVPFVELDSLFHQPGWRPLAEEQFQARVAELIAGDGWVVDGNYRAVREMIWTRADTVVWFDLPRRTVMRQIVWRTLGRAVTRRELWNGNREPMAGIFRLDPEQSIIRWAWTRHGVYRSRYALAAEDPALAHLTFVRIGSRRDARRLLDAPPA
jgi:adenylate kinase family enzyme